MNLILSGGGDAKDSRLLDQLLISEIPTGKSLLYIPIAWKSGNFETCKAWFESSFLALGFSDYTMITSLDGISYEDLEKFGGMYIGGGNTYSLLNDIRASGFEKILLQFMESDRPVYGGSAGAIIFGSTIDTAGFGTDADENSVGLVNTAGLNVVGGNAIQCHYNEDQDEEIIKFVAERNLPVIALSERSGLHVKDDSLAVVGFDKAFLFNESGKLGIPVADQINLNSHS